MKKILLIGLLLIVGCSKEQPINDETLIEKGGLKYHPDTKELYSGNVFKNRLGGMKKFEGSYKNGKKDGLWTEWYKNGQKMVENTWKDGKQVGLWTTWHENGQKKYEGTWKDGEKDGKSTFWHENGKEKKWEIYKNGKLIDGSICHAIINLLKTRGVKMPASDIDAFLKEQNVDLIKELCENMYHNGKINRTANYRYFILTEEQQKPKKASAPKSEEVDIEKELAKYKDLLDKGLITQEQYDAKSNELLGL